MTARLAAENLEQAHQVLAPVFSWKPEGKVAVVIVDSSDSANGATQVYQKHGMILYVAQPESYSGLRFYDDYLKMLCIHEYSHYLSMGPRFGSLKVLTDFFGEFSPPPNSFWYRWMAEGYAVYAETGFTSAGRGRSSEYDALLRATHEYKVLGTPSFLTFDQLVGLVPYFPGGVTHYQFGYHLINTLGRQKGKSGLTAERLLGQISKENANSWWFLSPLTSTHFVLRKMIGKNFPELWENFLENSLERAEKDLKTLHSSPLSSVEWVTLPARTDSHEVESALWDQDTLFYSMQSSDRRPGVYKKNSDSSKSIKIADRLGGGSLKKHPTLPWLLGSELNVKDSFYVNSDLRLTHTETYEQIQLTFGLRARDPDWSPDGKKIIFTIVTEQDVPFGSTSLALAQVDGSEQNFSLSPPEILAQSAPGDRVALPVFSFDGKKIIYSIHHKGKFAENIESFDLETKEIQVLVANGAMNRFPVVSPQGELYIVSDQTGVDNLYRVNADQSLTMVSNVTSGLRFPFFKNKDPDAFYASVLTPFGWDLARIPFLHEKLDPETLKISPPPVPVASVCSDKNEEPPSTIHFSEMQDYSVFPTILPRMWFPIFSFNSLGEQFGLRFNGFDATERHTYNGFASYVTYLKKTEWGVSYGNRLLFPTLGFSINNFIENIIFEQKKLLYLSQRLSGKFYADFYFNKLYSQRIMQFAGGIQWIKNEGDLSLFNDKKKSYVFFQQTITTSNQEVSPLAIDYERGGKAIFALQEISDQYFKASTIKAYTEFKFHYPLFDHVILTPQMQILGSSNPQVKNYVMQAVLSGRTSLAYSAVSGINSVYIRGYPLKTFYGSVAGLASLDLNFPILRIFRSIPWIPLFLKVVQGNTFLETSQVFDQSSFKNQSREMGFSSAGGGIRLHAMFLSFLPVSFEIQSQKGFNQARGGILDLFCFFQVGNSF